MMAAAETPAAPAGTTPAPVPTPEAPEFTFLCEPVLAHPTEQEVSILWATSAPASGWIEYGETPDLELKATGTAGGLMLFDERSFKVRLRNLKPGTTYHYRVGTCPIQFRSAYKIERGPTVYSAVHRFRTLNRSAEETTFTVWNDTHEHAETLKQLEAAHRAQPGDFMLWNGDVTNDIYTEDKMVGQFLSPKGVAFATDVPYFFVRGNHDVRGPAARHLHRFTEVDHSRWYYSFRQGPLAALVLDTGEDKPDSHPVYAGLNDFAAFRTLQAEWLEKEIQKPHFREAPYKVLFCHIPLRWHNEAYGGEFCADGRAKWHDLLVKAGVQLVVSGHTHQHAWLPATPEVPFAQLVGGGPKPEKATLIRGKATRQSLTVIMTRLDGTVLQEVTLPPLAV
ncbi:MAG: metallophosphoesterase [Verrucomicrobium sp.]|nr:FN3 domain-containing metallophosphoesterase family protein [Verrucomicrobium sp.]